MTALTSPHSRFDEADVRSVLASNRPHLLGIIKAVQTPLSEIDIKRKAAADAKR